jgi:nicotinate-nucleotide adenylyltransferase
MTRLAVLGHEGLFPSGVELDLPRPNFTADSLRFMRQRWPDDRFDLIVGSDNLAQFHLWRDHEEILLHHQLLVYPRPGFPEHLHQAQLRDHPSVIIMPDAPLMDISSTAIRAGIRNWGDVDDLVPAPVLSYLRQHNLYT